MPQSAVKLISARLFFSRDCFRSLPRKNSPRSGTHNFAALPVFGGLALPGLRVALPGRMLLILTGSRSRERPKVVLSPGSGCRQIALSGFVLRAYDRASRGVEVDALGASSELPEIVDTRSAQHDSPLQMVTLNVWANEYNPPCSGQDAHSAHLRAQSAESRGSK